MKKFTFTKETMIQATFIAFILLVTSCGFNQKSNDTKDVAEERNDEKFDDNKQKKDAQFLVNAAEISLEEIQLGQLAQQKGGTAEVKELGKMMEDAHTKSLNDLKVLAKSKMITIPTSPTDDAQEAYKELNEDTGNDFDKAYADMMVNEHNDAIETYEDASEDSNDNEIKNWARTSLPGLRTHLEHSVDCQNNLTAYNSQNN